MAILERRFYYHEKGNHDERWHFLARDTDTGRVFVINQYAPSGSELYRTESSLEGFLNEDNSTAKTNLLTLIGTLVE